MSDKQKRRAQYILRRVRQFKLNPYKAQDKLVELGIEPPKAIDMVGGVLRKLAA